MMSNVIIGLLHHTPSVVLGVSSTILGTLGNYSCLATQLGTVESFGFIVAREDLCISVAFSINGGDDVLVTGNSHEIHSISG